MTAFTFTSCEDVPAPYDTPNDNPIDRPVTIEPSGDGTEANPYNVAAIIAEAEKLSPGEESSENVYIKGIVTNITENYDGGYGNATYYISDDDDATNSFYIYRSKYFGNTSYSSGELLEYGDTVVVYGKITNYNGTYETVTNGSYIISINSEKGEGQDSGGDEPTPSFEPEGDGTLENPFNSVAAYQYTTALETDETSENDVYIKGIISKIVENYNNDFGNATYYISVDGTFDSKDSGNQFYIFRSLYLDNEKYTSGDLLNVGDEVIVYGKVTNYYGNTPETVTNKSYLYSWTKGEGGGSDQPGTSGEGLATITKSGATVTMVDPNATLSSNTITCTLNTYGWVNNSDPELITLSDGTTIAFAQEGGNNAPKYYEATNGVRMYALNSMTITGSNKIAKVVLTCDSYNGTDYIGNEQLYTEINENIWKTVNDWTGNSGGTQLRVKTIEITYAE